MDVETQQSSETQNSPPQIIDEQPFQTSNEQPFETFNEPVQTSEEQTQARPPRRLISEETEDDVQIGNYSIKETKKTSSTSPQSEVDEEIFQPETFQETNPQSDENDSRRPAQTNSSPNSSPNSPPTGTPAQQNNRNNPNNGNFPITNYTFFFSFWR